MPKKKTIEQAIENKAIQPKHEDNKLEKEVIALRQEISHIKRTISEHLNLNV